MFREKLFAVLMLVLSLPWAAMVYAQMTTIETPSMHIDITGGTSNIAARGTNNIYAFPIMISAPRLVRSIGVNWGGVGTDTNRHSNLIRSRHSTNHEESVAGI